MATTKPRKTKTKNVRAKSTIRKGASVNPEMAEFGTGIQKVLPKGQFENLTKLAKSAGFNDVSVYATKILGSHSRIIA